jgi:asparagine synthetase B (glutamine-hydrolysing)
VDDIFCLFQGHIENVAVLKQQYGLNKTANEVIIVIEAYRTLRDRGPYPADQVVKGILGKFAFILYDSTSKATFVAVVSDPFCLDCSPPLSVVLVVFISDCFVSVTSTA